MTLARTRPHYGGQMGLAALCCMLAMTSCATYAQQGQSGAASWLPGWAQVTKYQNKQVVTAQASTVEQPAATFVVRFDANPQITEVCKNFRRDTPAARAKFATWSKAHPELKGLVLARASYSGELVLALPKNDPDRRSPQQVLKDLKAMDNIVYADIDAIAQTGSGG